MAMFTAYFDASGNRRSTVLTVAGFVSTVRKWKRFDEEWTSILKSEGITRVHMTEFVSSQGEFSGWRGQSERRRVFMARLVECIRRNTNKGFASTVVMADYDAVNREFQLSERAGQPFVFAARSCLGGIARWALNKGIKPQEILINIEQGDEGEGELRRAARADGFVIAALDKEDAQAFQPGDIAAWKCRTLIHNVEHAPIANEEDGERLLASLDPIRRIVQNNGAFNRAALIGLCIRGSIPRREKTA